MISQQNYIMEWNVLPDPLLLMIFKRLVVKDVVSCSEVCGNWNAICNDQLLWKHLLVRDLEIKPNNTQGGTIRPKLETKDFSWKEDYIRLMDCVPCVATQTLKEHTDEVLHVAFSHNGAEIASCSRDNRIIRWKKDINDEFRMHSHIDMKIYNWTTIVDAQYNPSDTKLMAVGDIDNMQADIAIFSIEKTITLLCKLYGNPWYTMASWCNDHYFIGGQHEWRGNSNYSSFWLCSTPNFLFRPTGDNEANLITTSCLESDEESLEECYSWKNDFMYKMQLLKLSTLHGNGNFVIVHSRKQFQPDSVDWSDNEDIKTQAHLTTQLAGRRDKMLFHKPSNVLDFSSQLRLDSCYHIVSESEDMPKIDQNVFSDTQLCMIFANGEWDFLPHQIAFYRITLDRLNSKNHSTKPEKVLEMNGIIIGMSLSPDEEFLFVNVRAWSYDRNELPARINHSKHFNKNIEIKTVNLKTFEVEKSLSGHKGFTQGENVFRLYLGVSQDYVSSGSEDGNAYIWDQHYGVLLSKLHHDACVNCIAFNPKDQEMCVTASDDHSIKVWSSKRKVRLKEAN